MMMSRDDGELQKYDVFDASRRDAGVVYPMRSIAANAIESCFRLSFPTSSIIFSALIPAHAGMAPRPLLCS